MADEELIEQRLNMLKKSYQKLESVIDKIPDTVPDKIKQTIKESILNNRELKELIDGIDNHRPPRVFLIGRTGVGKSSLINAICGSYVATVSDVNVGTKDVETHNCIRGGRLLMQVCDSRGFAESEETKERASAEDLLLEQIIRFSPDIALFMLDATRRDDIQSDVLFLKRLAKSYSEQFEMRLPIIAVLNRCDGVAPSWLTHPSQYTKEKLDTIEEKIRYYQRIIDDNGLSINTIIAVSSLIGWKSKDGKVLTNKEINQLSIKEIEDLEIDFDGRYQIEELVDFLEDAIQDYQARMGVRMAGQFKAVLKRIARTLCKSFSNISAAVAVTPIPVSDVYFLTIIQAVLVLLIEHLSGREATLKAGLEFITSLGGVATAGVAFRWLAQQGAKLLNLLAPGAGSAISAGIAYGGTKIIGEAAIKYFIDGESMDDVKEYFISQMKLIKE